MHEVRWFPNLLGRAPLWRRRVDFPYVIRESLKLSHTLARGLERGRGDSGQLRVGPRFGVRARSMRGLLCRLLAGTARTRRLGG